MSSYKSPLLWLLHGLFVLSRLVSLFAQENSTDSTEAPAKQSSAYAKIPDHIEALVVAEESLSEKLSKMLADISKIAIDSDCEKYLAKYLADYEADKVVINAMPENVLKATAIKDNPLLTFRMVRRVVGGLLSASVTHCEENHENIVKTIDEEFSNRGIPKPEKQDLDDALVGILIHQFIYGLNASQISQGILNGVNTKVALTIGDCLAIAGEALLRHNLILAYQWIVAAQIIAESEGNKVNLESIQYLEQHWQQLVDIANKTTIKQLHKEFRGKTELRLSSSIEPYSDYAPCRGESLIPTGEQIILTCSYDQISDPYFFINPLKVEVISEDPLILQFYDFATDRDIEHIKSIGSIPEENGIDDQVVKNFNRKIEMISGLGIVKEEDFFQRGLFTPLGTLCQLEKLRGEFYPYDADREKNRIATFFIHLNEVKMGGNTIFIKAKTFAEPVKGSALLWFNWDMNGKRDERLKHDNCPCILGIKQIANRALGMPNGMILQCAKTSEPGTSTN